VTEASFLVRPEVRLIEGRLARPGTHEAIAGRGLIGHYAGVRLGGSFETAKNARFTIVGVFEAGGSAYESEIWTDLDALRASLGWRGYVSSVTAQLDSPAALDGFARALEGDPRLGVRVERERSYYEKASQNLFEAIIGLGALVTCIVSLGAMLGATITLYASVGQRVREIGLLRALGFRASHVLLAFLIESGALALAGAASGVLLALLTPFFDFATTNMATGQAVTFRFQPTLAALGGSTLVGALLGLMGGFFPALNASRISAREALRA
jgi:putative ABC transport system permease protein